MCGFAGSFNYYPNKKKWHSASNCIKYRGEILGFKKYENGAVVATRLPRTGNQNHPQPIVSKDGNILVFNGEIYNYKDIAKKIGLEHTNYSDAEILLFWLERSNAFILPDIEGEFSFVYIKPKANKLYMVRDFCGTKPLYYSIKGNSLVFGSSPKAVATLFEKESSINYTNSSDFLWYGVAPEGTVYLDVFFVTPGKIYEFENDKLTIKSLNLKYTKFKTPLKENIQKLVNQRILNYENECAIAYSGGVDSTIIRELAKNNYKNIKSYYLKTNKEKPNSELRTDSNFLLVNIAFDDIKKFSDIYIQAACRPVTSFSGVGMSVLISHAKANGAKIILSGECADEIFCGYPHYFTNSTGHPTLKNRERDKNIIQSILNTNSFIPPSDYIKKLLLSDKPDEWLYFDRFVRLPEHLCLMNSDIPSLLNKVESRLPFVDLFDIKYETIKKTSSPKKELFNILNELQINIKPDKKGLHVSFSILSDDFIFQMIENILDKPAVSNLIGIDVPKFKYLAINTINNITHFPLQTQSYVREILFRHIVGIYSFCVCLKESSDNINIDIFEKLITEENYSLLD